MKTFNRFTNGFELKITVDAEKVIADLEDIKKELLDSEDEEYERCAVYSYNEEFLSVEECVKDVDEAIAIVNEMVSEYYDGSKLFDEVQYKKNGTFKKNSKPILWTSKFGPYWEDSYGWHVMVLRLVPQSDTVVSVEVGSMTEHY